MQRIRDTRIPAPATEFSWGQYQQQWRVLRWWLHTTGAEGAFLDSSEPPRTQPWPTSVTHHQCANALCAANATTLCCVFNNSFVHFDVDLTDQVLLPNMYTGKTGMTGQLTWLSSLPQLLVLRRWVDSCRPR